MQALQMTGYGSIDQNLSMADIDKPEPGENEVPIEVYAAGLNPVDYKILSGAFRQVTRLSFPAPIGYDVDEVSKIYCILLQRVKKELLYGKILP